MNYPNRSINSTAYTSALERAAEITQHIEELQNKQSLTSKTSFSNVMSHLSSKEMKQKLDPMIEQIANEHNVDPNLVKAVVEQESAYNPNAISKAGALGLMQLMPGTARELGVKDPLNPVENVRAGTKYLSSLLNRYQGNVIMALSAYNAGIKATDEHKGVPPFTETRNYVNGILKKIT